MIGSLDSLLLTERIPTSSEIPLKAPLSSISFIISNEAMKATSMWLKIYAIKFKECMVLILISFTTSTVVEIHSTHLGVLCSLAISGAQSARHIDLT